MSTVVGTIVGAVIGAAAGIGGTYVVMNKRIKEKQEEVVEVRKIYAENCEKNGDFEKAEKIRNTGKDKATKEKKDSDQQKVDEIARENGYGGTKYSNADQVAIERPTHKRRDWIEPYIISPDEYREKEDDEDGWDTRTLFYFADNVLTDDQEDKIEDMSSLIGDPSVLTHFGEYEEDSIYVRNENRKIDYEVLLDQRKWSDVIKKRPKSRMEG